MAMEGRHASLQTHLLIAIITGSLLVFNGHAGGEMGINYGTVADNLPSPNATVSFLKGCVFKTVRIYDTNADILQAFTTASPPGGPFGILVGPYNADLKPLAEDDNYATNWVASNIVPFSTIPIRGIIAGSEAIPGPLASFVPGAMAKLRSALDAWQLDHIYVTTTMFGRCVANSYPPSATVFSEEAKDTIVQVVDFMKSVPAEKRGPIFAHVYPYFPYASEPQNIPQDYAMFRPTAPPVQDGDLTYGNLFDAMFDGYVWAMEKIGGEGIEIAVGETGWPSAGNGEITTPALASEYNSNLYTHVTTGGGTPRTKQRQTGWPNLVLTFSLFNEDNKPPGTEQNWGLLYPSLDPVYQTPMCPS